MPVRRKTRAGCCLSIGCCVILVAACAPSNSPGARTGTSSRVYQSDQTQGANFSRACQEISARRFEAARALAAELPSSERCATEGWVLAALATERQANPEENWLDSFARARQAAIENGLPLCFSYNQESPPSPGVRNVPVNESTSHEVEIEFLAAVLGESTPTRLIELAIANARVEVPLPLRILSFSVLPDRCAAGVDPPSLDLCRRASDLKQELAPQLGHELHESVYFALESELSAHPGTDVLSADAWRRIGAVAARGGYLVMPRSQMYEFYWNRYVEAGAQDPELAAAACVFRIFGSFRNSRYLEALKQSIATAAKADRIELMNTAREVGNAYVRENTATDWMIGAAFFDMASPATGHKHCTGKALSLYSALLVSALGDARMVDTWPIAQLRREAIEQRFQDEISLYHRMLGLRYPPDLRSSLLACWRGTMIANSRSSVSAPETMARTLAAGPARIPFALTAATQTSSTTSWEIQSISSTGTERSRSIWEQIRALQTRRASTTSAERPQRDFAATRGLRR